MPCTDERAYETTQYHDGYTVADLRKVFDRCKNPQDWKAAIAVQVPGELVNITIAAIQFFTATTPRVALDQRTMTYVIESEGYRAGPAGDH